MGREQSESIMPRGVSIHGKTLRITFSYNGKRCRESLGLEPTKTNIKFAAGKLAAIQHEIKTGIFSYITHFPKSERALQYEGRSVRVGVRIGELCEEYKAMKYIDIGSAAQRRYSVAFDQCLKIIGKDRLVSALYPEDITRMRTELISTRAASTANHYMMVIRGFFKYIIKNNYTKHDLLSELSHAKISSTDPDPFELIEFQRIINACRNDTHRNLITFAIYTGVRPGELSALAWEDIDFTKKTATIARAVSEKELKLPKTDRTRVILLSPPAIEALKNQQQISAMMPEKEFSIKLRGKKAQKISIHPVFIPVARAYKQKFPQLFSAASLNELWANILRRAGVRYRTFYQLRHTYACWNLTAHGNVAFIAKQMGHSDYTMLVKIYGRWMDNESEAENDRIWEALTKKGHDVKDPKMPQKIMNKS